MEYSDCAKLIASARSVEDVDQALEQIRQAGAFVPACKWLAQRKRAVLRTAAKRQRMEAEAFQRERNPAPYDCQEHETELRPGVKVKAKLVSRNGRKSWNVLGVWIGFWRHIPAPDQYLDITADWQRIHEIAALVYGMAPAMEEAVPLKRHAQIA